MKKGVAFSNLALAACVCAAAAALAGCGAGGTARLANPLDFFRQARENMREAASFRVSGEMTIELAGLDTPDAWMASADYDMAFEQKDGEPLARLSMSFKGLSGLDTVVGYIAGERLYMKMPDGTWVYKDVDLSSELANMGQGLGPQNFRQILDMAESAEVVAEDADTITYDLVLDYEKVLQQKGMDELREQLAGNGIPGIDLEQFTDFIKNMLSKMEYRMTVDKQTGLAASFRIALEMELESLADIFPGEIPRGAKLMIDSDYAFSDYGKSFDIELPEEVENAVPEKEYGRPVRT